jgi:hypothetical protein
LLPQIRAWRQSQQQALRPITSVVINSILHPTLSGRRRSWAINSPHLFLSKKFLDDEDETEKLRKREYQRNQNKKVFKNKGISKAEREEFFSKFVKALKWFQTKYGHLNIHNDYQLPYSDEEGLDEDIKGNNLGSGLNGIRGKAYFTAEPYKSQLIALGILPEPSPVSDNSYLSPPTYNVLYNSIMPTPPMALRLLYMRLKLIMVTLTLLWATRSTPAVEMDISMQGLQAWKERYWVRCWQISRSGVCTSLHLIYVSDGDL